MAKPVPIIAANAQAAGDVLTWRSGTDFAEQAANRPSVKDIKLRIKKVMVITAN
jgi:hypothetical protein